MNENLGRPHRDEIDHSGVSVSLWAGLITDLPLPVHRSGEDPSELLLSRSAGDPTAQTSSLLGCIVSSGFLGFNPDSSNQFLDKFLCSWDCILSVLMSYKCFPLEIGVA